MSRTLLNLSDYSNVVLPTLYQQQTHLTKYSRWSDELGRREMWPETVYRYLDFMVNHIHNGFGYTLTESEQRELYEGILFLHVMPSMRALMTAGPALQIDQASAYNCAFLTVDNLQAHDEAFYLSMCAVGVGFSVERQFTSAMPDLPREIHETDTVIVVPDSRIGWASAYRQLLSMLFSGFIPKWDVSRVRPAGARLKTFGGRASGPGPLVDLFRHAIDVIKSAVAAGQRRLTSLQNHDLMTKMADVAVSGGVRRAAMISLSNPSDQRMRDAKTGEWWTRSPHFRLANNSAVWTDKPSPEIFLEEWLALVKSKSGERGIINREALVAQAKKSRRIDVEKYSDSYGVNPCFAAGTMIATRDGAEPIEDLVGRTVPIWDGAEWRIINTFRETGRHQPILRFTMQDGAVLRVTPYHTMVLENGDRTQAKDVVVGQRLRLSSVEYSGEIREKAAYLKGFLVGDGTALGNGRPVLWLYPPKYVCKARLIESAEEAAGLSDYKNRTVQFVDFADGSSGRQERLIMRGLSARASELTGWADECKRRLPAAVYRWDRHSKEEFVAGLFDADGTARNSATHGFGYQISSIYREFLLDLQMLLKTMGVRSTLGLMDKGGLRDMPGGQYMCQPSWRLSLSQADSIRLSRTVRFERLVSYEDRSVIYDCKPRAGLVVSIEDDGEEETVYCCTVPVSHAIMVADGIVTGNCGEIIQRPRQFCNLTTNIIRHDDGLRQILSKVRLSTILGTLQSTLTDFRYLSPEWRKNCEEERLLGVSLNGIMDNRYMAGLDYIRDGSYLDAAFIRDGIKVELPETLSLLRDTAVEVNREWAAKIGINPSAAITTVKPEGNNSNLVDCRPGLHGAHAKSYYIRTNRANKVDKMAQFLISRGVVSEDDTMSPETAWVMYFPMSVPDTAISRHDYTAVEHLKLWSLYQQFYCEHKPSITVSVKDSEWLDVGAYVYDNFDAISGVAFLPFDGGTYRQAPYIECTKEEYEKLLAETPREINWGEFNEDGDYTEGAREFACVGNACSI